jgi:hypothetical protein
MSEVPVFEGAFVSGSKLNPLFVWGIYSNRPYQMGILGYDSITLPPFLACLP